MLMKLTKLKNEYLGLPFNNIYSTKVMWDYSLVLVVGIIAYMDWIIMDTVSLANDEVRRILR